MAQTGKTQAGKDPNIHIEMVKYKWEGYQVLSTETFTAQRSTYSPYCNDHLSEKKKDQLSGESDSNSLGKSKIDAIVKNL